MINNYFYEMLIRRSRSTTPVAIPTDYVFYAPFNGDYEDKSTDARTMQIYGVEPMFSTLNGVPCATFTNGSYVYTNDMGSISSGAHGITVSFWFKFSDRTSFSTWPHVFVVGQVGVASKGLIMYYNPNNGGSFIGGLEKKYDLPSGIMRDGVWHNYVIRYNPSNGLIEEYKDGVLFTSGTDNTLYFDLTGSVITLGGSSTTPIGASYNVAGYRIYNRVLTTREITALASEYAVDTQVVNLWAGVDTTVQFATGGGNNIWAQPTPDYGGTGYHSDVSQWQDIYFYPYHGVKYSLDNGTSWNNWIFDNVSGINKTFPVGNLMGLRKFEKKQGRNDVYMYDSHNNQVVVNDYSSGAGQYKVDLHFDKVAQDEDGCIFHAPLTDSLDDITPNARKCVIDGSDAQNVVRGVVKDGHACVYVPEYARLRYTMTGIPKYDTPRTISIWFYPSGFYSHNQTLFCYGGNGNNYSLFSLNYYRNSKYSLSCYWNDLEVETPVTGEWHNIVGVFTQTELKMYLDGALIGTKSTTSVSTNGDYITIGSRGNEFSENSIAWFADARIYDHALSAQEIANIYSEGLPEVSDSSVSGSSISDSSESFDSDLLWYTPFSTDYQEKVSRIIGSPTSAGICEIVPDSRFGGYLDMHKYDTGYWTGVQYPNTSDALQLGTGAFTIGYWLNAPYWNNYGQAIISHRSNGSWDSSNGFVIFKDWEYTMDMRIGTSSAQCKSFYVPTDGEWHYCLYERDANGNWGWYLDGELATSGTGFGSGHDGTCNSGVNVFIGGDADWGKPAVFKLAQLRIYDRALTLSEIQDLYHEFDEESDSDSQSQSQSESESQLGVVEFDGGSFQFANGTSDSGSLTATPSGCTFEIDPNYEGTIPTGVTIGSDGTVSYDGSDISSDEETATIPVIASADGYESTTGYVTVTVTKPEINTGDDSVTFASGSSDSHQLYADPTSEFTTYDTLPTGVTLGSDGTIYYDGTDVSTTETVYATVYVTSTYYKQATITVEITVTAPEEVDASDQTASFTGSNSEMYQITTVSPSETDCTFATSDSLPSGVTMDSTGLITYDGTTYQDAYSGSFGVEISATGYVSKTITVTLAISASVELPTDYKHRWELQSNLKEKNHSSNTDYDLTKSSGSSITYSAYGGMTGAVVPSGVCLYNLTYGAGISLHGGCLSFWAKCYNTPSSNSLCVLCNMSQSESTGFWVGYYHGNYVAGYDSTTGHFITSDVGANANWHNFVLNYDKDTLTYDLWIDGVKQATQTLASSHSKNTGLTINAGAAASASPTHSPDVSVRYAYVTCFDRTLTNAEIRGLYHEFN